MKGLEWFLVTLIVAMPFVLLAAAIHLHRQQMHQAQLYRWAQRIGLDPHRLQGLKRDLPQHHWRQWRPFVHLRQQLALAGFHSPAYVRAYLQFQLVAVLLGIWFVLLGGLPGVVLGMVMAVTPYAVLKVMQFRHRKKLMQQFPQMLESLVRALQAGHSIDSALVQLTETLADPLRYNIQQLAQQLQVGAGFRDALLRFRALTPVPEAHYFVATLTIQRETGGAIVPILERLSSMLRRREKFEGKVRVMTAETRFTANFLTLVPLAYLGYKLMFDSEGMRFFLEDPTGKKLLAVALGLIATGIVVMNRMMKVRL